MKQIAILGLGHFGKNSLEELLNFKVEIFIVDKNKELIDNYKDYDINAVALDILDVETLRKILPESTAAVIIDMGKCIEASILAASYCAKLNIPTITAVAETKQHGEILSLVGATMVVYPNREAAKRVCRHIISKSYINYIAVNESFAIGELEVPGFLVGKKLSESRLREDFGLNLLCMSGADGGFELRGPDYVFVDGDVGLFGGKDSELDKFCIAKRQKHRADGAAEKILKIARSIFENHV